MSRPIVALFLVTFMLLAITGARAQTFDGMVVTSQDQPIKGVSVMLLNDQKRATNFARTDASGRYAVKVPEEKNCPWLVFSGIGYQRDTISTEGFVQGQVQTLQEKALEIREVRVTAPRIYQRGDTLDFIVNQFRQKQDRSIEDVLKKIPGIHVNTNGSIEWQGKQINKFYIEGMDLLGSKYAQASQNLSADKVKKVQVMENHEPVKLLRGASFSEQAALNIILTEDAKNVWQGTMDLGIGSSAESNPELLGNVRLMAMLFTRKMQSISMYKANNTGDDVLHEVSVESIFGTGIPTESGILHNLSLGTPALKEQRTHFNNSHVLASNWLFKLSQDREMRLQVSGALDKSRQTRRTETEYNDVEGGATISEAVEAQSYENTVDAELKYQVNSEQNYLTNIVKGLLDYSRSTGTSKLNGREVSENVKPRRRYITEKLDWTHRFRNGRALSFNGYLSYNYLPGYLLLQNNESEWITFHSTFWGGSTYFRHYLGRVFLTYRLKHAGQSQHMDCNNALSVSTDHYAQSKTSLSATVNYKNQTWDVETEFPFAWLYRSYNGKQRDNALFEPSFRVRFTPNAYWAFTTGYHYAWTPLSLAAVSSSPVFTTYLNLRRGLGYMDNTRSHNISATINYKHTMLGLFGMLAYSYSRSQDNILHTATYENGFYTSRASDQRASSTSHYLSGSITKSFSWWRTNISLSGNYMQNNYSLLLLDVVTPFILRSGTATLSTYMQPQQWLSVEARSSYSATKQFNRQDYTQNSQLLSSFSHELTLFLMPGSWQIEWTHEFYHSNNKKIPTSYFSDFTISYRRKTYELGLQLTNIFDVTDYRQCFVTSTQRVFQINELRPREILAKISLNL